MMKKIIKFVPLLLSAVLFNSHIDANAVAAENEPAMEKIMTSANYDAKVDELFQQAMKEREDGDLLAAIEDFQTILNNNPFLHRVRLELAVASFMAYKPDIAIAEAQKVLDDPATPPNVRVAILAFIAQVQQNMNKMGASPHYWSFPVSISYLQDSNVNAGPGSYLLGDVTLTPDSKKRSDAGIITTAGMNHTYRTGKNIKLGKSPASLLWQSAASVYQRNYFDEKSYDFDVYTLRTGPTLISRGNWRANISLQEDFMRYGGENLAYFTYLLPSWTLHISDSLHTTVDLEMSRRDYTQKQDKGRDSVFLSGRVSLGKTFMADKFSLFGGIQYFNENADDSQYSTDGMNYFIDATWKIIEQSNAYVLYDHTETRYDEPPLPGTPGFAQSRDEICRIWTYGINYTFKNAGVLTDWTVDGKVRRTKMDSNLDAYEYTRTETFFTLSHTF